MQVAREPVQPRCCLEIATVHLSHNHPPLSVDVMLGLPSLNPMPGDMRELAVFLYDTTPSR
jgi:hypothetical protein